MNIYKNTLFLFLILLYVNLIISQESINLSGVIFDQSPSRDNDFEINPYSAAVTPNIVLPNLGADGTPTYCCGNNPVMNGNTYVVHNASTFYNWFHPVNGINIAIPISIKLTKNSNGVYSYYSNAFFPIDGKGFDNITAYPNEKHYLNHNYHFCMKIHTSFVYNGGEYFNFKGDDDVWVFFNNILRVDIGGIHQGATRSVYLDNLGLTRGLTYPFDFFYCERHTSASTLNIETNMSFKCLYYDKCGVCQGKNSTCCYDGKCLSLSNPCQLYTCSAESDYNCQRTIGECNDGDVCASHQCIRGVGCISRPNAKCDDNDECTLDFCDVKNNGACSHTQITCNDGDDCTDDICINGKCIHTPKDCDDGDECTSDSCAINGGCYYTRNICDDNLGCTIDTCDKTKGCVYTPVENCTECHEDDASKCITTDLCNPMVCDPLNNNTCIEKSLGCEVFGSECIGVECVNGQCIFTYLCETPAPTETPSIIDRNNHTLTPSHKTQPPTISVTPTPTPTPTGTPLTTNPSYPPENPPPSDLNKYCLTCKDLNCESQQSENLQTASCTYVKNDLYEDDSNCDDCCKWIPTCYFHDIIQIDPFNIQNSGV